MDFNKTGDIVISCALKLPLYLKQELSSLGHPVLDEGPTSVHTSGTLADTVKLNLNLRTANRVIFLIAEFEAATTGALHEGIKTNVDWEDVMSMHDYFSVISYADHPDINNTMYVNQLCKDGIADYFMDKYKSRPDSGPEKQKLVISIYWKNNKVKVYADTSGESLSRHGYRKVSFSAPLQETLAAAIIQATHWNGESHFINPMCGAGTLAIEAALTAAHRANGLLRSNYGFMHIKGYDPEIYKTEREKINNAVKPKLDIRIIATDHDPKAIKAARENAAIADVSHLIEFHVCDFSETLLPEGNGTVLINPPYGERMGDEKNLELIYRGIGDFFKRKCRGYAYVFTGNSRLAKQVGLKTKRKLEFYNAHIECRLLEYELYEGSRKKKEN